MDIFKLFLPQEIKFFEMLEKQSENLVRGSAAFEKFMKNYHKLKQPKRAEHVKVIKDIEHDGDMIIRHIVEALNKTFITPIDREDIHRLTTLMDDVMDFMYAGALRIQIYRVEKPDKYIIEMTDIIVDIVKEVDTLINNLNTKGGEMKANFIKINELENKADTVYRNALADIFAKEKNAITIVKLKDIYEILEIITDKAEDVANVVEGIVIKHG